MFAPAALLNPVSRRLHFTIHQSLSTSAIPQESLCNRRFLPSPQPSPCKGEGGEGASPQPSPCKGEGAIIPQELLWLCTSDERTDLAGNTDQAVSRQHPVRGPVPGILDG